MNDNEDVLILLSEHEETETELLRMKILNDKFESVVLQEMEKRQNEQTENSATKNLNDDSTLRSNASKNLPKKVREKRSMHSINSTRSYCSESRPSISKAVEKTIHDFENYMNILKQSKLPHEKLSFLDVLNNCNN